MKEPDPSSIDRIKRLTIVAVVSDDEFMQTLVLKGGNALDLIYHLAHRSSVDLDFSMPDAFDPATLESVRARIERALTRTFAEAGFRAFDVKLKEKPPAVSPELRDFWGGYGVEFKIIREELARKLKGDLEAMRRQAEEAGPEHRRTCLIDISKHEFCGVKSEQMLDGYTLYVYPPVLIALEKLRAICQQAPEYRSLVMKHFASRARDFFDIHAILDRYKLVLGAPENLALLRRVFEAKRVPLRLLGEMEATREQHREGFAMLKDSVHPGVDLQSFDYYFDEVAAMGKRLLQALGEP